MISATNSGVVRKLRRESTKPKGAARGGDKVSQMEEVTAAWEDAEQAS